MTTGQVLVELAPDTTVADKITACDQFCSHTLRMSSMQRGMTSPSLSPLGGRFI
jgi:hypothetical protein